MTKAFQKIYTKITNITKATCSLKATGVGNDELATVNGKLAQVAESAVLQFLFPPGISDQWQDCVCCGSTPERRDFLRPYLPACESSG